MVRTFNEHTILIYIYLSTFDIKIPYSEDGLRYPVANSLFFWVQKA
jgi:hypothetical protein